MAAFSRVTPTGWSQGDDASASSRVTPTGWEQVNATGGGGPTTYSYIATGGLTLAGAAALDKIKTYTATGGATLAGTATTAYVVGATTYGYTATGGLTLAGAAALAKIKAYTPSGGLTLAGLATVAKVKAFTATGGMTLSGVATTAYVVAGATTYTYTATGGLTLAGEAYLGKVKDYTATGGMAFAGTGTTAYVPGVVVRTYTATGGLVLDGAAVTSGPVLARGQRAAGAIGGAGRKKYRKPRPMRRVQIGNKDYLIPERDFPAFVEAMVRKQPPPPSVEVEPAQAPKPKIAKARPVQAATPVAQAFNDAVMEPEVEELREAVEEHRPDLLPAFYESALASYIERTVQGEVAKAIASIQPYLQASMSLQTEVRDMVRTLRRDLADDMHALGVMID